MYACMLHSIETLAIAEQSWVLVRWELYICMHILYAYKNACGNNLRSPIYGGYIGSKEVLVQNDHSQKLSLLLLSWVHS